MSAQLRYKYCLVPMCSNTSRKTPNKLFLGFPKNIETRKKWCQAMKRDPTKNKVISPKSHLHCCEDHFNLEKDVDNYMRVKLMGGRMFLKRGVIPHKFDCQKKLEPQSPTSADQQNSEGPNNVATQTCSLGKKDKAVQANVRCRVRSKGTSTSTLHTYTACSPMKFDHVSWTTNMSGRHRTPPTKVCVMCVEPREIQRTLNAKSPAKAKEQKSPKPVERLFINEGAIDERRRQFEEDPFCLETTDNIKRESAENGETPSEHPNTFAIPVISPILKSPVARGAVQISNGQGYKQKNHIEKEFEMFGRMIANFLNEMPIGDALELQLELRQVITDSRLRKCEKLSDIFHR